MTKVNSVRHASAWNHRTVETDTADVDSPHNIAGCRATALATTVDPLTPVPLSANGTRLGGKGFIHLNGAGHLVGQHGNDDTTASLADLLGLHAAHLLCRVVERFADVGFGMGEGVGHLARGLVAQVADTPVVPIEHPALPALKFVIAPTTLGLSRLLGGYFSKTFVPQANHRFHKPATDQHGLGSVRGSEQRVDTQVTTNDVTGSANRIGNLAHQFDFAEVQPDFHEPAGNCYPRRNADVQLAGLSAWECQPAIAKLGRLVSEDDAAVLGFTERVLCIGPAAPPQSARCRHGLAEIGNGLLHGLGVQVGESPLGVLLPCRLARPRFAGRAQVGVSFDEPVPHGGGF